MVSPSGNPRAENLFAILEALQRAGGVKTKVAEELGLTPRGLAKKMRRLGL